MSYVHVTYNSKTTKVCHLIIENSDDYHQIANNFLNAKKTFDLPNGYYYFFYKGLPKEEKKKWDKKFKSIQTYKMLSEKKGKKK